MSYSYCLGWYAKLYRMKFIIPPPPSNYRIVAQETKGNGAGAWSLHSLTVRKFALPFYCTACFGPLLQGVIKDSCDEIERRNRKYCLLLNPNFCVSILFLLLFVVVDCQTTVSTVHCLTTPTMLQDERLWLIVLNLKHIMPLFSFTCAW